MRQDQFAVSVNLDGVDLGIWDKLTGGEVDSEETTYKPGAMAPRVSLGGSVNVGNVTVSRLFDIDRDGGIVHWLIGRAGKGSIVIKKTPLDVDGNADTAIKPLTYSGKLKQVNAPEVDSESSDAALIELEMTPAGTVA
jgi:hypothetical protein